MGKIKTYNPKEVTDGPREPHRHRAMLMTAFVTIDPNGDGVTKKGRVRRRDRPQHQP